MAEQRSVATPDNWWDPPAGRWTYEQVKDLDVPFDWELMDGVIVVRGSAALWHDLVRDRLFMHLELARPKPLVGNVERGVLLDESTAVKPDIVMYDWQGLDVATLECCPVANVKLAVEVVSSGSQLRDRDVKPVILARAGVPYFWRVERSEDAMPVVHEYWLNRDRSEYFPAPEHPEHHDKLVTDVPFPVEIDLRTCARF